MDNSISTIPVSVVIPVYNAEKFLQQCIESINCGLQNTAMPAEIILIDDCSTDSSLAVATSLSSEHQNIRILKSQKNSGAAASRKIGISCATQEFIALVDADDFLQEGAIQDAFIRFDDEVDLVIWELWKYELDGIERRTLANPRSFPIKGEEALLNSLGGWGVHPLGIARKHLYLKIYKDFSVNSYNADELITRLLFRESRTIVGSTKKYFYRTNPNSTTQAISDKHLTGLRSHIWLIDLCQITNNSPKIKVISNAVSSAYYFFKNRHLYNKDKFRSELYNFTRHCSKSLYFWKNLTMKPKHFLAFIFLYLYSIQQSLKINHENDAN